MPIVAREENTKNIVRRPYNYHKSHKCETCGQRFSSKEALEKHMASIHTVKILEVGKGFRTVLPTKQVEKLPVAKEVTKEDTMSSKTVQDSSLYRRSEQAEKDDEARRENSIIRSSDRPNCRFCKSESFLDLECPERKKKAPVLDVFDSEAFLEAEFRKFMRDQVPDDTKVFTPEDLEVLQETKSEHMPRCPECHDDFFWPTPSHSCVFTAHGRVVVGGQLVGNLPCLDQTVPPPPDCRVCPPWIKCVQCSATFRGKAELKAHKEIDHPVKRNTVPSTQSGQPQTEAREKDFERKVRGPYNKSKIRVNQIKVPTTWQVLPSKPLKRSAENILFNLPKSTRIELNGEWLNARQNITKERIQAPARKLKLVQRQCDDCGEKFDSATAFGEHLSDPLSDMFVCMKCASEGQEEIGDFPNQCQLTKHKKSDHVKQSNDHFGCSSCGLSCKSRFLLKKHTQSTMSCKQISARQLLSTGKLKMPLNSAVSIHYSPDVATPMEVDNGKEVTESVILAAFKKVETLQKEPYSNMPCLYCAKMFNNTVKLIMHMNEKHNVEYENDSYLIPCIYCDEEFKDKGKLKKHTEENHKRNISPMTVEVNHEDFKMLFPQEQVKVKQEIFPDYREFEEKVGSEDKVELDELVEGELDERVEMTKHLMDLWWTG